ncbi:MAG: tripartite tricarboxylate transporter substrate-binding protein [Gemmatimonadota bacterium]
MKRRDWLTAVAAAMALGAPRARSVAQAGVSRAPCLTRGRVRWLVGWSPGGGYDAYSRLLEPYLEQALGVEIVIDNVPGAAGRVAAATLARARPDGRTLGILDGPGLLWAAAMQEGNAVDLARDFSILARLAGRQVLLAAGPRSRVTSLAELLAVARNRRLVFASTAPGSVNFVSSAVVAHILGIEVDFVVGYPGSREVALAVLRGDADATTLDVETLAGMVGRDGLAPLLALGREDAPYARLDSVPHLTSDGGVLARIGDAARAPGEVAAALDAFLDLGRLVAGPRLPTALEGCMRASAWTALNDPRFHAAAARAGRSLDLVSGERLTNAIPASRDAMRRVFPIAEAAARRAR